MLNPPEIWTQTFTKGKRRNGKGNRGQNLVKAACAKRTSSLPKVKVPAVYFTGKDPNKRLIIITIPPLNSPPFPPIPEPHLSLFLYPETISSFSSLEKYQRTLGVTKWLWTLQTGQALMVECRSIWGRLWAPPLQPLMQAMQKGWSQWERTPNLLSEGLIFPSTFSRQTQHSTSWLCLSLWINFTPLSHCLLWSSTSWKEGGEKEGGEREVGGKGEGEKKSGEEIFWANI